MSNHKTIRLVWEMLQLLSTFNCIIIKIEHNLLLE